MAAQADGRRIFTTIESEHNLKVIDTAADKVIDTIPLTGMPNQCAVTPNGRFVGVPIRDGNGVDIIDMTQNKVVKTLPVNVPHNCSIINARARREVARIKVGKAPKRLVAVAVPAA